LGFVVINATEKPLTRRFETGLPGGKYYDFIAGQLIEDKMSGPTVEVENYGFVTITVKPFDALVIALGFTV
jgi:alpha-amylase